MPKSSMLSVVYQSHTNVRVAGEAGQEREKNYPWSLQRRGAKAISSCITKSSYFSISRRII